MQDFSEDDLTDITNCNIPFKFQEDITCPNCGYCKHCGRGGRYYFHHTTPYSPPNTPYYQTWDNISWTTTNVTDPKIGTVTYMVK